MLRTGQAAGDKKVDAALQEQSGRRPPRTQNSLNHDDRLQRREPGRATQSLPEFIGKTSTPAPSTPAPSIPVLSIPALHQAEPNLSASSQPKRRDQADLPLKDRKTAALPRKSREPDQRSHTAPLPRAKKTASERGVERGSGSKPRRETHKSEAKRDPLALPAATLKGACDAAMTELGRGPQTLQVEEYIEFISKNIGGALEVGAPINVNALEFVARHALSTTAHERLIAAADLYNQAQRTGSSNALTSIAEEPRLLPSEEAQPFPWDNFASPRPKDLQSRQQLRATIVQALCEAAKDVVEHLAALRGSSDVYNPTSENAIEASIASLVKYVRSKSKYDLALDQNILAEKTKYVRQDILKKFNLAVDIYHAWIS